VLLRELRFTSPEIAETLGMPVSTVVRSCLGAGSASDRDRGQTSRPTGMSGRGRASSSTST
jgi:hypothetical protein